MWLLRQTQTEGPAGLEASRGIAGRVPGGSPGRSQGERRGELTGHAASAGRPGGRVASPRPQGESLRYQPDADGTLRRGSPHLHPPSGAGGQKPWALQMPPPPPTPWRGVPEHHPAPGRSSRLSHWTRPGAPCTCRAEQDSPGHWEVQGYSCDFFSKRVDDGWHS